MQYAPLYAGGGAGPGVVAYQTPAIPRLTQVSEREIQEELVRVREQAALVSRDRFVSFIAEIGSFDSKWHRGSSNQALFEFRGRTLKGSDLNYYFQGILFKEKGIPLTVLKNATRAYKWAMYRVVPSPETIWAMEQGFADG